MVRLMLSLALALPPQGSGPVADTADTLLLRAESLLVAGQLPEARRLAERAESRRPNDPRVLTLLGRIHLVWPVVGRMTAESLFTRAMRLSPGDPEPAYFLGMTGVALGGDDGDEAGHTGFVAALAINPDYRDTWQQWLTVYRGDEQKRDGVAALARHAGRWTADYWRAQLLVELRRADDAIPILESVVRQRPADPGPWAWLARARFAAGQAEAGASAYTTALDNAAADTGRVLWRQIRGIASDAERAAWDNTSPGGRAAFIRLFWSRREPDISTRLNERMVEHFRRLTEAQRTFALRHPNSNYFRSNLSRAMSGEVASLPLGLAEAESHADESQCASRSIRRDAVRFGVRPRLDTNMATRNVEELLDDRGRVYLRHGEPTYRYVGSTSDETWCYILGDSVLRVTFVRRTGGIGATGDMVVTPMSERDVEAAASLLATDHFTEQPTLSFTFRPASFRAESDRRTELLIMPDSVWAAATLVDDAGREVARDSGSGRPLRLTAEPGSYQLAVDARRGERAGRYRGGIFLPDFGVDAPTVSSLLLAASGVPASRDTLATAEPALLVLPAAQSLRVYAEIYNLTPRDGAAHYRAEYRFESTENRSLFGNRPRVTNIGFSREVAFTPRIVETLIVDPGRLPRGRYRLHLDILDEVRSIRAESVVIQFELR